MWKNKIISLIGKDSQLVLPALDLRTQVVLGIALCDMLDQRAIVW